jgi:hypothetical protein
MPEPHDAQFRKQIGRKKKKERLGDPTFDKCTMSLSKTFYEHTNMPGFIGFCW